MSLEQRDSNGIVGTEDAAKGPMGETIATAQVPLGFVILLVAFVCALAFYFWRG